MLQFLPLSEWKKRADKIRFSVAELATDAGVDSSNIFRKLRDNTDMQSRNAVKLTEALIGRERELFDYLAALHPDWIAEHTASREREAA